MSITTDTREPDVPSITRKKSTGLQRRVLAAGSIGQFIEFYDFSLYGLTAVIFTQQFFPQNNSTATGLLIVFATFGVAFAVRPLGGLFFGQLGDKIGRRKTLVITLLLVGIATAGIGVLPTFAQIGWLAPALLVLCRLGQGFSAGGESVGGPSFVFEHAPVERRGLWINITLAATALPSVFAASLFLGLSTVLSDASFESWGWRIPFLLALPLAFIGIWIRKYTEESELFTKSVEVRPEGFSPLRNAFNTNLMPMVHVLLVLGTTALGFYMLSAYFVTYVQVAGDLTRESALLANALAMVTYTILLPIMGRLSDKVGRRPMLYAGGILLATTSVPAFMLVTSGNLGLALLGQTIYVIALTTYGGGCYTFFVEVFNTSSRFTSAAISYNISYAVFGGSAPYMATFLIEQTGSDIAPGWYMAIMAAVLLVLMIVTRVPETRGQIR